MYLSVILFIDKLGETLISNKCIQLFSKLCSQNLEFEPMETMCSVAHIIQCKKANKLQVDLCVRDNLLIGDTNRNDPNFKL